MSTQKTRGPSPSTGEAGPHWREFPVSWCGNAALASGGVFVGLGTGLSAVLALLLGIGVPIELGLLQRAFAAAGAAPAQVELFVTRFDPLMRVGVVAVAVLAAIAMCCGAVAAVVADTAVSRALMRAAVADAPRAAVPAPFQVQRVARDRPAPVDVMLIIVTVLAGLTAAVLIVSGLVSGFGEAIAAGGIAIVVFAGLVGLTVGLRRVRGRLRAERLITAAHWTPADEEPVWDAARAASSAELGYETGTQSRTSPPASKRVGRNRWVTRGIRLGVGAFFALLLVPLTTMLVVGLFFPDARRFGRGIWVTGEPLPTGSASVVGWLLVVVLLLLLLAWVMLPVCAVLCEWLGTRAEHRTLVESLAKPDAARPPASVLQAHSERRVPESALVCAQVGGFGIAPGLTMLWVALVTAPGLDMDDGSFFEAFLLPGMLITAVSAVLLLTAHVLSIRDGHAGREMRNHLMARWPVLPQPRTATVREKTVPVRATVGPALSPLEGPRADQNTDA